MLVVDIYQMMLFIERRNFVNVACCLNSFNRKRNAAFELSLNLNTVEFSGPYCAIVVDNYNSWHNICNWMQPNGITVNVLYT